MAGKGRRAAARQGELSRRRKRGQRGPSGVPATPPLPEELQPSNGGGLTLAVEAAGAVSAAAGAEPVQAEVRAPQRPVVQPRGQGRQRGERPAAHHYVGSELRRIGVLATAAVAALVALSFVL